MNFFPYFGGKYRLAKKLIQMFPRHHCYVEVFGGAGNVLLQKPASKVEVFNDIDSDIYNLFRVLREDFDEFHRLVMLTLYCRKTFTDYRTQLETETDNVKRAARWYAMACQSFSGFHGESWSFSKRCNKSKQLKNKIDRLPEIIDRLREVQIENRDFKFILDSYDGTDTFFYLDPPYVPGTRRDRVYAHEMTAEDHERLLDILKGVKGKVMLSGYPNAMYDSLGWHQHKIETVAHSAGTTRISGLQGQGNVLETQKRTESIWTNYTLTEQCQLDFTKVTHEFTTPSKALGT